jgi:hypothetical protein
MEVVDLFGFYTSVMGNVDTAILVLVTFLSLGIIFVVFTLLIRSVVGDIRALPERWKFRKKKRLLAQADELLKTGSLRQASSVLMDSFYLDQIKVDPSLIDSTLNHHLDILSRVISVTEKHSGHLDDLPILEDLLHSRSQLMKGWFERIYAREKLRRKKAEDGRSAPGWAAQEFTRQLDEIKDRLTTNRLSLISRLKDLFGSLEKMRLEGEVTYH